MELTWIIAAVLGLIMIYLLFVMCNQNLDYWEKRGVPHEKPLPFFGNMLDVVTGKKGFADIANNIYTSCKGKKYVGFMMFSEPVLVIRDIDLINQVLIKDFSYFQDRFLPVDSESEIMHAGMQFMTGERWRVLRHKLTRTFTSGKMKMMFEQIKECTNEVVLYLKDRPGKELEARDFFMKVVLNVIGTTSFGIKVDALNENTEKENEFYQNSKNFFTPSIFLQLKFLIATSAPKLKERLGIKLSDDTVNNFFKKLINDLIEYRENSGTKRNDFLQLMLEQKQKENNLLSLGANAYDNDNENLPQDEDEPEDIELLDHLKNVKYDKNAAIFTNQVITGQAFVFISGGSDTVATTLGFTMYELATNMDVQKRLQEEVDLGLKDRDFTYDALKKIPYLEQVLNESLRLYPAAGTLLRACTEDYKIPGTDVIIEKGKFVHIPVKSIHYDPQYYFEPEKFNPDRFENMETFPKGIFFPFGGGPRICVAMRLAMFEMKILLAILMLNYTVVLSDRTKVPLEMKMNSILPRARDGVWIRFKPRDNV